MKKLKLRNIIKSVLKESSHNQPKLFEQFGPNAVLGYKKIRGKVCSGWGLNDPSQILCSNYNLGQTYGWATPGGGWLNPEGNEFTNADIGRPIFIGGPTTNSPSSYPHLANLPYPQNVHPCQIVIKLTEFLNPINCNATLSDGSPMYNCEPFHIQVGWPNNSLGAYLNASKCRLEQDVSDFGINLGDSSGDCPDPSASNYVASGRDCNNTQPGASFLNLGCQSPVVDCSCCVYEDINIEDPLLPPKPITSPIDIDPIEDPTDPIEDPTDPIEDPADPLLDCSSFYAMSQNYQDGCCEKCQDSNTPITPNHQCYPYCHCCSKLKERFQKLANIK